MESGEVGQNGTMPRYVRPPHDELVEAAIDAFGNRARVAILRHVRENGPCTRADIATALGIAPPTASNHLSALETAGLIESSPPRSEARSGQWVRYTAVPERITELYVALGKFLGQSEP
ncbi:ArsR/SmtB family transcription factor [Cryobacterium sp. W22_MBD10_FK3]|uniref:ArsR/SmtB family transcription factor n=1 Tax=Cryobacterium sp. W22_MBD10_FK3 TaxID=3240273 RepID=UPI003F917800